MLRVLGLTDFLAYTKDTAETLEHKKEDLQSLMNSMLTQGPCSSRLAHRGINQSINWFCLKTGVLTVFMVHFHTKRLWDTEITRDCE